MLKCGLVPVFCSLVVVCGCAAPHSETTPGAGNQAIDGALTFDEGIARIVEEISRPLSGRYIVAVTDFPDISGKETLTGRHIAEGLIAPLVSTGQFSVIERQLLDKIDEEQELSLSGKIDPDSAMKLGRILGVDALVTGTVADFGKTCRINTRLISTQTGAILSAATTDVIKATIGGGQVGGLVSGNQREQAFSTGPEKSVSPDVLVLDEEALQNMEIVSGQWHIEQDRLANGKIENILRQNDLGADKRIYFGNPELMDYEFSFYIKANKSSPWPIVSVIFRNKEPGVYYEWAIGEGYQTFVNMVSTNRLYYQSGNVRPKLHGSGGELPVGSWHHISVTVQGNSIACYLDGNVIHQAVHDGSYKGRVGFVTHGTDASFGEIKIRQF